MSSTATTVFGRNASVNCTYSTCQEQENDFDMGSERSIAEVAVLCVLLTAIISAAIFGNALVCAAVYRSRTLRGQVSNVFIVNLALTDFLNAALVMPATFVSLIENRWVLSEHWCYGVCFLNYCFIIVSMWTLGLVSMDRYFAVVMPFRYTAIVTHTRAVLAVAFTWLLGFTFASPPVFMRWVWYDNLEAICAINWESHTQQVVSYTLSAFAVCFCVPGLVILFAYVGIYRVARRHSRRIRAEIEQVAQSNVNSNANGQPETTRWASERSNSDEPNQRSQNPKRKGADNSKASPSKGKAVRTIVTMVAVFFVCLTPFCVTKVLKAVYVDNYIVGVWINTVGALLAFSNSCCNPVIYSITRRDFRASFARSLQCLRRPSKINSVLGTVVSGTSPNALG